MSWELWELLSEINPSLFSSFSKDIQPQNTKDPPCHCFLPQVRMVSHIPALSGVKKDSFALQKNSGQVFGFFSFLVNTDESHRCETVFSVCYSFAHISYIYAKFNGMFQVQKDIKPQFQTHMTNLGWNNQSFLKSISKLGATMGSFE